MQFSPARSSHRPRENIVPMINVVFLLLIFFLMTAQIAPPDPFSVTPPGSSSEVNADGLATLYIASNGMLAFRQTRGEDAVFAALALLPKDISLLIRADASLEAAELVGLLSWLAEIGIADVALVTTRAAN